MKHKGVVIHFQIDGRTFLQISSYMANHESHLMGGTSVISTKVNGTPVTLSLRPEEFDDTQNMDAGGDWSLIPMEHRDTKHVDYLAWIAFIRAMRNRTYGAEETLDAWNNFLIGWHGSEDNRA